MIRKLAVFIMFFGCYILNKIFFINLINLNLSIKIGSLLLVVIFSKIIYLTMIFMLKVISIKDLKGYIQK